MSKEKEKLARLYTELERVNKILILAKSQKEFVIARIQEIELIEYKRALNV